MKTWKQITKETENKSKTLLQECKTLHQLIVKKNELIGKNSSLMQVFKNLNIAEKKIFNKQLQKIKQKVEKIFFKQEKQLETKQPKNKITITETFFNTQNLKLKNNQTLIKINQNTLPINLNNEQDHPLNMVVEQIHNFCNQMNWKFMPSEVLTSVESNFMLLNIEKNHPARNKTDCFYINDQTILRTHATNTTSKILSEYQEKTDNFFTYTIGNVYRNDTDDSTHLPQFTQFDACLMDSNLSMTNFKGILINFCQFIFGKTMQYRFRSSYFPFTEPSLEMDIYCTFCSTTGCNVCNNSGWIELLGAGIINPEVLKKCNISKNKIIFAFGIGIERIAMLKYKIKDIRLLYKNNLKKDYK